MTTEDAAALVIKEFEGSILCPNTARWDVNAYRLGFGSDKIELPDGTHRDVVKGDCTTLPYAIKDLARRIGEPYPHGFLAKAKHQIGDNEWEKLPVQAKAALISIVYNYGSIPKNEHNNYKNDIVDAAKTGDMNKLSDAILATTIGDNNGVNDTRRRKEAALVRYSKLPKGISSLPTIIGISVGIIGISLLVWYLIKRYKK